MRYITGYQLRGMRKGRKSYFNQHFEVAQRSACEAHSDILSNYYAHILIATKIKIRKIICFISELCYICQNERLTSAH